MTEISEMTYQQRTHDINEMRMSLLRGETISDEQITETIRMSIANRAEIGANKPKSRQAKTPPTLDQLFEDI